MNLKICFTLCTLFVNVCVYNVYIFFKKIVFFLNNIIEIINIHHIKQKNRKFTKSIYGCYI